MFYWALIAINWCATATWLHLFFQSDVAFTAVMRYNLSDPIYPVSWPERRGIPHKAVEPTFPSEWRAIAQEEPIPSFIHTFHLPLQDLPRRIWVIFTAVPVPWQPASQAGVFQITFPDPPTYTLLDYEEWTP